MKQDFTEVMSKRTDEDLIEIVKVTRDDYQPEAIEAAERELEKRQVNSERIEQFQEKLTQKETKKKAFDSSKVSSWTRLIHFLLWSASLPIPIFILSLKIFKNNTNYTEFNEK